MKGWLPNQHGAWAMLAIPAILGTWHRMNTGQPTLHLWTLIPLWIFGYFAYFAICQWLKAPAVRRAAYVPALTTYTVVACMFASLSLLLGGLSLAAWSVFFAPLLLGSFVLVKLRRERSLLNGIFTVTAAALFYGPCVQPLIGKALPDHVLWLRIATLALFFIATVFSVKVLLRQRGNTRWWIASLVVHVGLLVFVVAMATKQFLSWDLTGVAVLWLLRAAILPVLQRRGVRLRPLPIGLIELVLAIVLLIVFL